MVLQSGGQEVTCFILMGPHMLKSFPQRHFVMTEVEQLFACTVLGTPRDASLDPTRGFGIDPIHSPALQLAATGPQSTTSLRQVYTQPPA